MLPDKKRLEQLCATIINKQNITSKEDWGKNLSQFLSENKEAFFTVIQPGGNNGDELIYKGLNKELVNFNIKYDERKYRDGIISKKIIDINKRFGTNLKEVNINKKTNIILVHGGGNMDDKWGQGTRLLKNLILNFDIPIAVAPQTFHFMKTNLPEVLRKAKQEIYLFCREETSYLFLKNMQLPRNIKVQLSDDTAFYLNKEDFPCPDCDTKSDYALLCFRTDEESKTSLEIINKFKEVLMDMNLEIINKDISLNHSFKDFVSVIAGAKIVVTDRLHVGISSSILEKPILLLPNSYFKNKAVYEFSIKNFPATHFMEC